MSRDEPATLDRHGSAGPWVLVHVLGMTPSVLAILGLARMASLGLNRTTSTAVRGDLS